MVPVGRRHESFQHEDSWITDIREGLDLRSSFFRLHRCSLVSPGYCWEEQSEDGLEGGGIHEVRWWV